MSAGSAGTSGNGKAEGGDPVIPELVRKGFDLAKYGAPLDPRAPRCRDGKCRIKNRLR